MALVEVLEDAVVNGELTLQADPESMARAIETTLSGSLITWAIYRLSQRKADV